MNFKIIKYLSILALALTWSVSSEAEPKREYIHLKFEFTGGDGYVVNLMEVPLGECKVLKEKLFKEYESACIGCKALINECTGSIPVNYKGVFEKKSIGHPYAYMKTKYREVAIYEKFSKQLFDSICKIQKSQEKSTVCIH